MTIDVNARVSAGGDFEETRLSERPEKLRRRKNHRSVPARNVDRLGRCGAARQKLQDVRPDQVQGVSREVDEVVGRSPVRVLNVASLDFPDRVVVDDNLTLIEGSNP